MGSVGSYTYSVLNWNDGMNSHFRGPLIVNVDNVHAPPHATDETRFPLAIIDTDFPIPGLPSANSREVPSRSSQLTGGALRGASASFSFSRVLA